MDNLQFKRVTRKVRDSFSKKGLTGFDMHFHTNYSMDGLSKVQNTLAKAAKLGIGVAITDHNRMRGATACQNNWRSVPIIPGIEVTCKEGTHMLMYFYSHDELRDFYTKNILSGIKKNPFYAKLALKELLDISKDYNCINSAPHPFSPGVTGVIHNKLTKDMIKKINHVEVLNGYTLHKMNTQAIEWAAEINKKPTAGSDGHSTSELGTTLTFVDGTTPDEVLDAIRKGKTSIVGKEENLLKKLILAVDKESLFIKRSHRTQQASLLLKSQFENEYNYIMNKIKNRKSRTLHHFRKRHISKR